MSASYLCRMRIRKASEPESITAPAKGVATDSDLGKATAEIKAALAGIPGTLEVEGGVKFGEGALFVRWVNRENTKPGSLDWHNSPVSVTLWCHGFSTSGKAPAKVKVEPNNSKWVRGKTGPLDVIVRYIIKSIKGLAETTPDDRKVSTNAKTQRRASDLRSPAEKALGLQSGELYGADEESFTETKKRIEGYDVVFSENNDTNTVTAWVKGLGNVASKANFESFDLVAKVREILKRVRAGEDLKAVKKDLVKFAATKRLAKVLRVLERVGQRTASADVEFKASDLKREFRDLSDEDAKQIVKIADDANSTHSVDAALTTIDKLLGTYGVEAVTMEGAYVDRYYMNIVALYCNSGDAYNSTILYDTENHSWHLTSYGDFIEEWERKHPSDSDS